MARRGWRTFPRESLILLLVFALSRWIYFRLGVRFNLEPLDGYWQFIDSQLLITRPLESLAHLHSQPPLWNTYLAVVLSLPAPLPWPTFAASFLLLGAVLACGLLTLLGELGVTSSLRLAAACLFAASPAVVLYENQLFYTYPVLTALVWAAVCLHRFLRFRSTATLAGFCGLLAGVALTRSLFHLIYVLAAVVSVALLAGPARRKAVACGGLAMLLVTSWYGWNYVRFGNFGASSWFGMNLAKMVVRAATGTERRALAAFAPEARILARLPFRPLAVYAEYVPLPLPTGIALLDQIEKRPGVPNYHHLGYVAVSQRYREAALWAIRHRPHLYLRGLSTAWRLYFRSPADEKLLEPNALRVEPIERWFRLAGGQRRRMSVADKVGPREFGWLLAAAWMAAVVRGWLRVRQNGWRSPHGATLAFLLLTVLYVAVVGNAFDLGENNRFALLVQPFVLCLLLAPPMRALARD